MPQKTQSRCLSDDFKVLGIPVDERIGLGTDRRGRSGREGVENGADRFMTSWRTEDDLQRSEARHARRVIPGKKLLLIGGPMPFLGVCGCGLRSFDFSCLSTLATVNLVA